MKYKITFPHMGNYYIPISYVIKKITKCEVIIPSFNNKNSIKIGSQYSPSEVCMPFKYNLGNYIDALNKGANILIQAGGGCRYGFFAELQEQILENLGYNFRFVNLIKNGHISLVKLYKFAKELNSKINVFTYLYYIIQGILIIVFMDKLDDYQRINSAKSKEPKKIENINKIILKLYNRENLSIYKIIKIYLNCRQKLKEIPFRESNQIKILLIGELYTLMDNEANNNIESNLLKEGIIIYRYTNLSYLLLKKKFNQNRIISKSKKYLKYQLGADGAESVYHALEHSKKGIDGIIHIKSYGCVPELNAIPILNEICEDYHIPILYLSFDSENQNANIDTKLEAFCDMLKAKKNKTKQF